MSFFGKTICCGFNIGFNIIGITFEIGNKPKKTKASQTYTLVSSKLLFDDQFTKVITIVKWFHIWIHITTFLFLVTSLKTSLSPGPY